jgi:rubredoxin
MRRIFLACRTCGYVWEAIHWVEGAWWTEGSSWESAIMRCYCPACGAKHEAVVFDREERMDV